MSGPPAAAGQVVVEPPLEPGEAFHTRFSGFVRDESGQMVLDASGIVGSVIGLRDAPRPQGQHWISEPQRMFVTAAQVGQVFGIAIDDAEPPNIYLTATSAFGLHTDGSGKWQSAMWGPGGGPGTIWKLNGANNYQPEIFANVTLDGRPNTGAPLGNIAYDPVHRQLFVSDLETGMIHRFDMDGNELGRFDHGVQGRTAFFNAMTGVQESRAPVAFDPASAAQIGNCAAGAFDRTPSCWNYADFRRRVYGLAVRKGKDGKVRLYYSVWGSAAFGNPDWENAVDDKVNTVWSVGLSDDGSFDPADVRLEFVLPDFFVPGTARAGQGPSHAVTDIAFPRCAAQNKMALAERGMVRNLGPSERKPFAWPHESRVLRYLLDVDGVWRPMGRHDVGFRERRQPPRLRANAGGGLDFGYGYGPEGLDLKRPNGFLWMSGDSLCSPEGACFNPTTGQRDDTSQVHGITGTPSNLIEEVSPPAAHQITAGEATPPRGPLASLMIDSDINVDAAGQPIAEELQRDDGTFPGDVEIYRVCTEGVQVQKAGGFLPPPPPMDVPAAPPPVAPPVHGLAQSHNRFASSGHYTGRSWHNAARSWHFLGRSWHRRYLSWHWRGRSWHYRYGSWHSPGRSWHYRFGSWHARKRSWHWRNRSWHTRKRSWHYRTRSWHNPGLSWHARSRSWHWRARSWHAKGLSWHNIGRSWHRSKLSWHRRLRSWHARPLSWHMKGVSYHRRGLSRHVKGRSWHKVGL
ncbi:MAG TPA: hypothetical protein ENK13_02020, partial [Thermopetrobacter sp.]|nr:hypothetical protein [Thermopetrobacter sp.]